MAKIETNLTTEQVRMIEALFAGSYGVRIGKRSGETTHVPYPAVAEWHPTTFRRVFEYGAQRFINDRIGGSDTDTAAKADAARALMEKVVSGDWGRAPSTGVDALTAEVRKIVGGMIRAQVGKEAWANEWKDAEDLDERIDAVFAKQPDAAREKITAKAQDEIDRRAKAREELAAIGAELAL